MTAANMIHLAKTRNVALQCLLKKERKEKKEKDKEKKFLKKKKKKIILESKIAAVTLTLLP